MNIQFFQSFVLPSFHSLGRLSNFLLSSVYSQVLCLTTSITMPIVASFVHHRVIETCSGLSLFSGFCFSPLSIMHTRLNAHSILFHIIALLSYAKHLDSTRMNTLFNIRRSSHLKSFFLFFIPYISVGIIQKLAF
jgi:hypothetical protein